MMVRLVQGDYTGGFKLFADLSADNFESIPEDWEQLWILAMLSYVSAMLRDYRRAEKLYARLLPHSGLLIVIPQVFSFVAPVDRFLGLLAQCKSKKPELSAEQRCEELQRARTHFESAIDWCARAEVYPYLTEAQYEYGRMLIRMPAERERAIELLVSAEQTARTYGMIRIANNIRAILDSPGPASFS
jgi:hypothetical protein